MIAKHQSVELKSSDTLIGALCRLHSKVYYCRLPSERTPSFRCCWASKQAFGPISLNRMVEYRKPSWSASMLRNNFSEVNVVTPVFLHLDVIPYIYALLPDAWSYTFSTYLNSWVISCTSWIYRFEEHIFTYSFIVSITSLEAQISSAHCFGTEV